MDSIKIEDYLQNRQPNKTGTCKQCGKQIPWNRQKLGNHKRSGNCLGQSKQEQNMFKSLNTNSTIFIGNQPLDIAFAKFEEIRTQLTISRTLCQPVETRWYSQYECLKSVIMNRDTLSLLGNINDIFRNNETDKRFLSDIHDIDFWNKAIELRDVLGTPTSLIGKFEKKRLQAVRNIQFFPRTRKIAKLE